MDWTEGKGISVDVVAGIHNAGIPLCVLGLALKDGKTNGTGLTLNENAKLTGNGCAVYSNATKKDAIESNSGALVEAGFICASGGVKGDVDNFDPAPLTDCPQVTDPLKTRPEPTIGSCDYTNVQFGFKKSINASEKMVKDDIKTETANESGDGKGKKKFKEKETKPVNTSNYDRSVVTLEPGVYCGGLTVGGGVTANLRVRRLHH